MVRSTVRVLSVASLLGVVTTGAVLLTQESAEPADAVTAEAAAAALPASAALTLGAEKHAAAVSNQRNATLAAERAAAEAAAKSAAAKKAAEAKAAAVRAAAEQRAAREAARARAARDAVRDPRGVARVLLADHGWGAGQFSCLNKLWMKESGWKHTATNPSSGAYGIPQSLPARKMASAGADYRTNPVTQIRWGLSYIEDRFGTPCGAWAHSQSHGWY